MRITVNENTRVNGIGARFFGAVVRTEPATESDSELMVEMPRKLLH